MKSLEEEFFDEPEFGSVSLNDLDVKASWDSTENPKEWCFVYARTMTRDTPFYNEKIYRVRRSFTGDPLVENGGVGTMTEDEIIDKMPRKAAQNYVVPSPRGEYITVVEVRANEQEDGTIELDTITGTKTIPVEFVKRKMSYDEVVVELLNDNMS